MKNLWKLITGLAGLAMIGGVVYYLLKSCHAKEEGSDEFLEDEFAEEEEEEKRSAPHARGYFNLNSIREAESTDTE